MTGFYFGKHCALHPELNGKRYATSSRPCVACSTLSGIRYRAKRKKNKGTYYFGKVCPRHPELFGKRFSSANSCVGCANAQRVSPVKRKEYLANLTPRARKRKNSMLRQARVSRRLRLGKFYAGKICEKHPELSGKRYTTTSACVECVK